MIIYCTFREVCAVVPKGCSTRGLAMCDTHTVLKSSCSFAESPNSFYLCTPQRGFQRVFSCQEGGLHGELESTYYVSSNAASQCRLS